MHRAPSARLKTHEREDNPELNFRHTKRSALLRTIDGRRARSFLYRKYKKAYTENLLTAVTERLPYAVQMDARNFRCW